MPEVNQSRDALAHPSLSWSGMRHLYNSYTYRGESETVSGEVELHRWPFHTLVKCISIMPLVTWRGSPKLGSELFSSNNHDWQAPIIWLANPFLILFIVIFNNACLVLKCLHDSELLLQGNLKEMIACKERERTVHRQVYKKDRPFFRKNYHIGVLVKLDSQIKGNHQLSWREHTGKRGKSNNKWLASTLSRVDWTPTPYFSYSYLCLPRGFFSTLELEKDKACNSWGSGWAQSRKGMFSRAGVRSKSYPIEHHNSFFALSQP